MARGTASSRCRPGRRSKDMNEPSAITAGDTIMWAQSLPDYPAPTWHLQYALRAPDLPLITITSTAQGSDHLISVAPVTSLTWPAGSYAFQVYAVNSGTGARVTVGTGTIIIRPDFATA